MLNASLSSTYAPVMAEAKRAGVPLLFASSVCPKDVYPPADPLQFCTTAFAANYDSRAALGFIKETAKEPVKLGLLGDGDPALARRDRFCRGAGQDARHDAGGQGDHPAADARLHAVRHQDQGCGRELGITPGRRG